MKITVTELECIAFINLRYGNKFSLHVFKKNGIEQFQRFKDVMSAMRARVANVWKDVNLAWIKDFKTIMFAKKEKKYEDPSAEVKVQISKQIKGIQSLIDLLGLKKDFKIIENINMVNGFHKSQVCSSYPTTLFVP